MRTKKITVHHIAKNVTEYFLNQHKLCRFTRVSDSMVKNPSANTGDAGSIPGSGRSPGEGNGNTLQYSCLEIPWTEEPGGCSSPWGRRVRHDLETKQWQQERDETTLYVMLWWPLLWTQESSPCVTQSGSAFRGFTPTEPISHLKHKRSFYLLALLGCEGKSTKYGLPHQTGSGSIHVPPLGGSTSCLVAQTDCSISLGSLSSIRHS